jgi:hypothetical protein
MKHLSGLSIEQLDQSVTVYVPDTYGRGDDEYLPLNHIGVAVDDDVLDADHIVLMNLSQGGE